jgi:hypothetical protein
MRFAGLAKTMLDRGIAVIPCSPNTKKPALVLHGALDCSLDPAQIAAWDARQPNCNCGAVATPDGFWFLDTDDEVIIGEILAATGQPGMPETYTVKTSRGMHYYFLQNDVSRRMGNVVVAGRLEARVNWLYVISPGSLHPSGKRYEVISDIPIIEAPAWLTDWLERHGSARALTKGKPGIPNASSVNESLVWLNQWMHHYQVEALALPVPNTAGGHKIFVTCPQEDQHTTESGITESAILVGPDGAYSFKCQHSHCAQLNWAKFREAHEPALTPERLAILTGFTPKSEEPRPAEYPASPQSLAASEVAQTAPQARTDTTPRDSSLDFDHAALYGPLGELALNLKAPLGLVYLCLITAYGVLVPQTLDIRTNLYCTLLGKAGGFKGESFTRATAALHVPSKRENLVSDRGVERALAEVKGGRVLIYQDEFGSALKKMAIPNATLAGTICQLWGSDHAGSSDKQGVQPVSARMSMIGNIPAETPAQFRLLFPPETSLGLYDRMLFGRADQGEGSKYSRFSKLGLDELKSLPPVTVYVQDERWDQMNDWIDAMLVQFPSLGRQGRLGEMLLRVAVILASANGETELSDRAFASALALCAWQYRLRLHYAPSLGINLGAQINEAILAIMAEYPGQAVSCRKMLGRAKLGLGCSARDISMEFTSMLAIRELDCNPEKTKCWIPAPASASAPAAQPDSSDEGDFQ